MKSDVEMRKCAVMRKAAYSRDIRPEFVCVLSSDCIQSVSNELCRDQSEWIRKLIVIFFQVQNNDSDSTIIAIKSQQQARENQLVPIAHELSDDHYFVVVTKDLSDEQLYKLPMYAFVYF